MEEKNMEKLENYRESFVNLIFDLKRIAMLNELDFDCSFKQNGFVLLELFRQQEYSVMVDGVAFFYDKHDVSLCFYVYQQESENSLIRDSILKNYSTVKEASDDEFKEIWKRTFKEVYDDNK